MDVKRWIATIIGTAVLTSIGPLQSAHAQKPKDETPVVRLTVTPAAEPVPALRYSLLPEFSQQKPGNAASYYYRALLAFGSVPEADRKSYERRNSEWSDMPLDQLPKKEIHDVIDQFHGTFHALETAAFREHCDWDLRLRDLEGPEVVMFLLPEVQELRAMARLLHMKARLEIAEGRHEDAIKTLQLGYKMGQDTGKPLTLVHGLVGIALTDIMNEQVEQLINADGSPNLYWALTALPQPAIDMRPAMRLEMSFGTRMFKFLKDVETVQRSPEEWRRLLIQTFKELEMFGGMVGNGGSREAVQWGVTALAMHGYPKAKRLLIAGGMDPKRVEAMPVAQVVAIHTSRTYRHIADEMFKWSLLPEAEAFQKMRQAEDRLEELSKDEIIPLARWLFPALSATRHAQLRLDRRIAALRTVEAIRMHTAVHGGRLPKSLDEITVVLPAIDPLSGKRFPYRLEGKTAILEIPTAEYDLDARQGRRYEITVVPAKRK